MTRRRAHSYLPKRPRRRHAVRWHVGDADKATIYGMACKLVHDGADGKIFQSLADEKINFPFTPDQYENLLESQDFDLEPGALDLKAAKAKLAAGVASIADLAKSAQAVVDLREIAVWKLREMCEDGRASRYESAVQTAIDEEIQAHVDTEARKHGYVSISLPKAHEFLKWVRWYDQMGKLGLVPKIHKRGNRTERYVGAVYALVAKHARTFLRAERPTKELAYGDLKVEIKKLNEERRRAGQPDLPTPDYDYMRLVINKLSPFVVDAARHLDEHATRKFHPSRGGIPDLFRPMQRIEMDDWECHLHSLAIEAELWEHLSPEVQEAAEKTRCVLSAAICCVTRVLPAVVLSLGPHSVNTKTLLRMCMSDKTPLAAYIGCETPYEYRGNPWQAAGDEGSAILNSITNGICQAAGIEYLCPQIETPQQRARVERFFQTLEIRSLLRFSGRTFSNPQVRGKYEAEARAVTTPEELATLILRFIVDVYHNTPHDGLDGQTPRACWLELTKTLAPRAAGKPLLRRTFGERYTVTLQPNGIEIFGNVYSHPLLEDRFTSLPQRDYTVIVDEEDLGGISVELEQGKWLEVPGPDCMNGVSADVWNMALASMRRENKHVEKISEPIVLRAIGYAQEADAKTRARLSIRFRLKTPEELEALRKSIGPAIRHDAKRRALRGPRPTEQLDMFAGAIPVGTKAPPRDDARALSPPKETEDGPVVQRGTAKPARPKSAKPDKSPKPLTSGITTRKPVQPWKPKERK
ncbi:integrase [Bradyrhizobium sp. SZCCHNR1039]|uniref:integrase n=1 Tax=Bradyrhizobium sp. SZCCHNR1039 TaxID=3057350 RepID=UPI00291627DA|nr:integrase [Bradyrhizobium sp. SZCCHNR1039]